MHRTALLIVSLVAVLATGCLRAVPAGPGGPCASDSDCPVQQCYCWDGSVAKSQTCGPTTGKCEDGCTAACAGACGHVPNDADCVQHDVWGGGIQSPARGVGESCTSSDECWNAECVSDGRGSFCSAQCASDADCNGLRCTEYRVAGGTMRGCLTAGSTWCNRGGANGVCRCRDGAMGDRYPPEAVGEQCSTCDAVCQTHGGELSNAPDCIEPLFTRQRPGPSANGTLGDTCFSGRGCADAPCASTVFGRNWGFCTRTCESDADCGELVCKSFTQGATQQKYCATRQMTWCNVD